MRMGALIVQLLFLLFSPAASKLNPEFVGEPPPQTPLDVESADVRGALRFVMTELRRLSNRYRYMDLIKCHSAALAAANFDGTNMFLDVEFELLRDQVAFILSLTRNFSHLSRTHASPYAASDSFPF